MCGIIGIISNKSVTHRIIESLKRLEYRGYDSAGIATILKNNFNLLRSKGKIAELERKLTSCEIDGHIGIGHTRWATHGEPSDANAHPHITENVAVVHNGIIENFKSIKDELQDHGIEFKTETDTEVIPCLIEYYLSEGLSEREATITAIKRLEGAFAIAVIFKKNPNLMIGAKKGAPLVVGIGQNENFLGSDSYALCHLCSNIIYLEEEDIAILSNENFEIIDKNNKPVKRTVKHINLASESSTKGNFQHFMQKEIYEQPITLSDNLHAYLDFDNKKILLDFLELDFSAIKKINIIACGTSYYAGMVSKYWFESIARIPVEIEFASEFRYRDICFIDGTLNIFISQSGETADTLAALKFVKDNNQKSLAIVNVEECSMQRLADCSMQIHAGPEIGVASTKAFTAQLLTLSYLVLQAAIQKKLLSSAQVERYLQSLIEVPGRVSALLSIEEHVKNIAKQISTSHSVLYIGRGTSYAVALEGALKLKELSYIHAEALAAGELKHGTIALIDDKMPVIAIAPNDHLFDKTASNIFGVAARGGRIITMSDKTSNNNFAEVAKYRIDMPETNILTAPILYAIPIQLFAYHTALDKGTDVDQPRNLAKSVTVE